MRTFSPYIMHNNKIFYKKKYTRAAVKTNADPDIYNNYSKNTEIKPSGVYLGLGLFKYNR